MDLTAARHISERAEIPLEDVLYMPLGREIVFRRGQKPAITSRYEIIKDERYKKITAEYEKNIAIQEYEDFFNGLD